MKTKSNIHFTQEQVTTILEQVAQEKEGFNKVLSYSLYQKQLYFSPK